MQESCQYGHDLEVKLYNLNVCGKRNGTASSDASPVPVSEWDVVYQFGFRPFDLGCCGRIEVPWFHVGGIILGVRAFMNPARVPSVNVGENPTTTPTNTNIGVGVHFMGYDARKTCIIQRVLRIVHFLFPLVPRPVLNVPQSRIR